MSIQDPSEQQGVSPVDVLRTLAARWRTITIVTGASVVAATVAALLSTPVYRAEVLLSYNEDNFPDASVSALASQFSGLSAIADLGIGLSAGQKDVALALLTSRGFLEAFISENDLLPTLFGSRWSAERYCRHHRPRWLMAPDIFVTAS
jgi:uncharacterized protein involved in exopolysaccharide biosynthesis